MSIAQNEASASPGCMQTVTVAQYLARRLGELGVEHLFGVPGDFSLTLLDHLLAEGRQEWVGSPNELGAGYAEVIKYGILGDPGFFAWCEANGPAVLAGDREAQEYAVTQSVAATERNVSRHMKLTAA